MLEVHPEGGTQAGEEKFHARCWVRSGASNGRPGWPDVRFDDWLNGVLEADRPRLRRLFGRRERRLRKRARKVLRARNRAAAKAPPPPPVPAAKRAKRTSSSWDAWKLRTQDRASNYGTLTGDKDRF